MIYGSLYFACFFLYGPALDFVFVILCEDPAFVVRLTSSLKMEDGFFKLIKIALAIDDSRIQWVQFGLDKIERIFKIGLHYKYW